jgi:hypothetical protein
VARGPQTRVAVVAAAATPTRPALEAADGGSLATAAELPERVATAPSGRVAAACLGSSLLLLQLDPSGAPVERCRREHGPSPPSALAFAPAGALLASGTVDGSLHLWRATDLSPLASLRAHDKKVLSVAWGAGGWLASAGADGVAHVLWLPDAAPAPAAAPGALLRAHTLPALAARWVTQAAPSRGRRRRLPSPGRFQYERVAWLPDGRLLTLESSQFGGAVAVLWRFVADDGKAAPAGMAGVSDTVLVADPAATTATTTAATAAAELDAGATASGTLVRKHRGPPTPEMEVAAGLWPAPASAPPSPAAGAAAPPSPAAGPLGPEGTWVAQRWAVLHSGPVTSLALEPGGARVAFGCVDGGVVVARVDGLRVLRRVADLHSFGVQALAWVAPDEAAAAGARQAWLLTVSADSQVALTRVAAGGGGARCAGLVLSLLLLPLLAVVAALALLAAPHAIGSSAVHSDWLEPCHLQRWAGRAEAWTRPAAAWLPRALTPDPQGWQQQCDAWTQRDE